MLRAPIVLLTMALAGCGSAEREENTRIMDRIEATADLPEGWDGISDRRRYYAFAPSPNGRNRVTAKFVFSKQAGRQWVTHEALPDGTDQGCLVIDVEYDVRADKVLSATCNGSI